MKLSLDQKIRRACGLFAGLRSDEADEEIYFRVNGLVFDELLRFVVENLGKTQASLLHAQIEELWQAQKNKEADRLPFFASRVILRHLSDYTDGRKLLIKLEHRLDHFLVNLVLAAEVKHKANENQGAYV